MTCLIVDDEPSAQQILERYISDVPRLELLKSCDDALQARSYLTDHHADLLLLDINMPTLSGISFLKSLRNPPEVILTTAYDEYALEGYELDVIDYLLKPFSFERFLQAISKYEDRVQNDNQQNTLFIKADHKTYRIDSDSISYIESLGDYITIHISDKKLTTYETLKNIQTKLPSNFMRVHKSFIVCIDKVNYLEGNRLILSTDEIPIGGTYREKVKSRFNIS
ncbi:response regulator transcription factor [Aliifodinibius halophilus]|uniref:Response regulator transcription factor n=1 Tax=Fodinibius halophilus TaxID=1736908 RepID=A0A6M1TCL2_9BACT|nr:response regulator transcription factor [Fodinibius halophilus]